MLNNYKTLTGAVLLAACFAAPASAALVDSSLIPDGDYVVAVERIVDTKHVIVKMDNGVESEIGAAATLSFDLSAHVRRMKIFVYKGLIITFKAV